MEICNGAQLTVFEVEMQLGYDARNVDALIVTHATAVVGWGLQLGELPLSDLALTDGPYFTINNHVSWFNLDRGRVGVGEKGECIESTR